jgi:hypothetical protein
MGSQRLTHIIIAILDQEGDALAVQVGAASCLT